MHCHDFFFFKEIYYIESVQVCTRINYKTVPVTSFNKYLHCGTIFFLINLLRIIYTRCTKISYRIVPCNQFHYIGTYKQVEKNSMTKNRGGNVCSEK